MWPRCSLDALEGAKNDDAQHDDETDSKGNGKKKWIYEFTPVSVEENSCSIVSA